MSEPTYEQRMSQMEKLLETSIKMIRRHDEEIEDLREMTRQNTTSIAQLTNQMGELTLMFQESMGVMRGMQEQITQMQSEVRGLQRENRRILERVFGPEKDD